MSSDSSLTSAQATGPSESAACTSSAEAQRTTGADRLRPIFLALGESVSYDEIRLVVTHLEVTAPRG